MSFSNITTRLVADSSVATVAALVPVWSENADAHLIDRAGEFTCGSHAASDIQIGMTGVAPRHCSVCQHNGIVTVVPVAGYPVWLNESAIDVPHRLQSGDSLAIGPATFRVEMRTVAQNPPPVTPALSAELVEKIERLEQRVAEAESGAAVSAPSAFFEARLAEQSLRRPVVPRRERELIEREEELNRRSEMLQQQLTMFKQRRQRQEDRTLADAAALAAQQEAFEAEREQLLAELQQETDRQNEQLAA
ncbi:MAG: FHA domain-containing protein [Planctomycetaceae bacterium]|nr:FHA domain-containing protein [Planctomycetaceae bacterium]